MIVIGIYEYINDNICSDNNAVLRDEDCYDNDNDNDNDR
jgi:hypothetical protein